MMIHPLSDVQSIHIGEATSIWQFAVVLPGAVIGSNCNICAHTFIENEVSLGNNVTIKNGVYLWNGIQIEDDVFVGPSVVFTNNLRPRSKQHMQSPLTIIKKGASLGAGSIILGGVTIGEYAMTGIGAVVTRDVPAYALVYGNPARVMGWVDEKGKKLSPYANNEWISEDGIQYNESAGGLTRL